jgi:hypothetical protein
MDIKGINNQFQFSKDIKNNKLDKDDKKAAKDKLELSEQAKVLSKTQNDEAKKLDEISEKIEAKYYDSDDVINDVAKKLLKDIKSDNK